VGYVLLASGGYHAALWSGRADSFVDLHTVLGTNYSSSSATAIWSNENTSFVVGIAGGHAMLWTIREVPDVPPLRVTTWRSLSGGNVVTLAWTNNGSACVLEGSGSLTSGWSTVSTPWTTNADWILTTVTNAASVQFFRLRGD
jgi:hypothetical protein